MKRLLLTLFASWTYLLAQDGSAFLEPHRPYSIGDYKQFVYKKLGMPRSKCSMFVFPNIFGSEYSINIFEKTSASGETTYRIEYAIASRLIWQTIPFATGKNSLKAYNAIKVKRVAAELPTSLAQKIIQVWESGTKATRYDNQHHGLDGVSYDFAFERLYYGTAWCPERGYPRFLRDIGEELVLFVQATSTNRQQHLARINRLIIASQLPK